jgi:uncharacterized protein YecT (DUF1311 family)
MENHQPQGLNLNAIPTNCKRQLRFCLLITALLGSLVACDRQPTTDTPQVDTHSGHSNTLANADRQLWQTIDDNALKLEQHINTLVTSIEAFLDAPSTQTLKASQSAWIDVHTTDLALYPTQLLAENTNGVFEGLLGSLARINARPVQPGYLDRFGPYEYSGLVYDIGVELTRENLIKQHQLLDEEEIVLGIYAIEFMLFGEDGKRDANDYQAKLQLSVTASEAGLKDVQELPENRRRRLLQLQNTLLAADIAELARKSENNNKNKMKHAWSSLSDQEKTSAVRDATQHILTKVLIGLANLETQLASDTEIPTAHAGTSDVELKTRELITQLASCTPLANYLSSTEKTTLLSAIEDAQSILSPNTLLGLETHDRKQTIKALYNKIQSLM